MNKRQRIAVALLGAGPAARSGMGLWTRPLLAWTVLVAPVGPVNDALRCAAAGVPAAVEPLTWACAAATVVGGAALALCGPLLTFLRRRRGERRAAAHPGEPWRRDRDWGPSATQKFMSRSPVFVWISVLASALIAWMFVVIAIVGASGSHAFDLPTLVPVLAAPGFLAEIAFLRVRAGKRRSVVVSWPSLPQHVGGRVAFHVGTPEGGPNVVEARLVLRCLRETKGGFLGLARGAEPLWRAEFVVPEGLVAGPGSDLRVEFDVPADAPDTDFFAERPVFWELVVVGRRTYGLGRLSPIGEPVLVPVYRRAE